MEYDEISNYMKETVERINSDKKRLKVIIDSINSGNKKDNMNDMLIANLSGTDSGDAKMDSAIEYITIILTNMESHKLSTDKDVIDELLIILSHNLDTLKSIEMCFNNIKNKIDCTLKDITASEPTHILNKKIDLSWLKAKSGLANTILYLIILFIVLFGMYEYDKTSLKAISKTTTSVQNTLIVPKK